MIDATMHALIEYGLVTPAALGQAIATAEGSGTDWLEQLVLQGHLDEDAYCACLSHVLLVPRCEPRRMAHIPPGVLAELPREIALEHHAIPVWVDAEGDLHVAMVSPADSQRWEEVRFFAGNGNRRRVMREIIGPTAMAWAHHHYYGVASTLWPPASQHPQAQAVGAQR